MASFIDIGLKPELKPLQEKEVPKVIQAVRQAQNRKIMVKLLSRIRVCVFLHVISQLLTLFQMSEEQPVFRQLMRLRGFSLMTNVMDDYRDDAEILLLVSSHESVIMHLFTLHPDCPMHVQMASYCA